MSRRLVLLLLVASSDAGAGLLYKCSDAAGQVSIQSQACPAGSTQLWKRDAAAEAAPTPEQQAAAAAKRQRESEDAQALSRSAGTTAPPPPAPVPAVSPPLEEEVPLTSKGPCRRAHELAAELRAMAWLELDQSQQQRLERWVIDQCEQARTGD